MRKLRIAAAEAPAEPPGSEIDTAGLSEAGTHITIENLAPGVVESYEADPPRVDAETAIILHEAYGKIEALSRTDPTALYDYVRAVAGKIAPVDGFLVAPVPANGPGQIPLCAYGFGVDLYTRDPALKGQTAWMLKHRQTYRFAYDSGAALRGGVQITDDLRVPEDAVTVPLFRPAKDGPHQLFGMLSMQSATPDSYDDNAVRAFEWLGGVVERVMSREDQDRGEAPTEEQTTEVVERTAPPRAEESLSELIQLGFRGGLAVSVLAERMNVDEEKVQNGLAQLAALGYIAAANGSFPAGSVAAEAVFPFVVRRQEGPVFVDSSVTDSDAAIRTNLVTGEDQTEDPGLPIPPGLSNRQRVILLLVDQGMSTEVIADALGIPKAAVRSQMMTIRQKLSARSESEAVARARDAGLIR
jgi:DNA-binding CsgD family transcriptional regulator